MLDVALGPDLDIPIQTRLIRGADVVAQRAAIRMQQHLGDWVLDTRVGIPWIAILETKPPQPSVVEAYVRRELAGIPGVTTVQSVVATVTDQALSIVALVTVDGADVQVSLSAAPGDRNFAVAAHVLSSATVR